MRSQSKLEELAERLMGSLPVDLKPSELGYVLSLMVKGHALALKERGM
jgi:hypothetical protein